MLDPMLKCDACGGPIVESSAIMMKSGHAFCCEDHRNAFSDRYQNHWPEPKSQENEVVGANDRKRKIKFIGLTFLSACLVGMAFFLYEASSLFRGEPLNMVALLSTGALTLLMAWFYYFFSRMQRAFLLMARFDPGDLEEREFADHIESLYREKEIDKKEVLLVAKFAFNSELDIVAKKIRNGEI